jgi:pimeloyl-ACP methyl ester carboxylesterase
MDSAVLDGHVLEYDVSGSGEPVVFIHGSFIADTFRLLVTKGPLADRHTLITYHRRGYAGSSRVIGRFGVADQAGDCQALLRYLRIERAHVVGHSFGGAVALQLALQEPDLVRSLALLEPALMVGATGGSYRESLQMAIDSYSDANAAAVVNGFLEARWPGYRAAVEEVLPGALEQAVADAGTTLESELPGLLDWSFDEAEARRIRQPALVVLGSESDALWARFGETHRLLLGWLPHSEGFVLPRATHFLQVQNPDDMAEALSNFYARLGD